MHNFDEHPPYSPLKGGIRMECPLEGTAKSCAFCRGVGAWMRNFDDTPLTPPSRGGIRMKYPLEGTAKSGAFCRGVGAWLLWIGKGKCSIFDIRCFDNSKAIKKFKFKQKSHNGKKNLHKQARSSGTVLCLFCRIGFWPWAISYCLIRG